LTGVMVSIRSACSAAGAAATSPSLTFFGMISNDSN
jgi:hypothetical protein